MAYINTVDEKRGGGYQTLSAGALDAPAGLNQNFVVAEGYLNAGYGALISTYSTRDKDTYSLGQLSRGEYSINVNGFNWDYLNSIYSGYYSFTVYDAFGTPIGTNYFGDYKLIVYSPGTYYVNIEGYSYSTEYEIYYTRSELKNTPATLSGYISGSLTPGSKVSVYGTYSDADGTLGASPTFFWYTSANGTNWDLVGTSPTYSINSQDKNKLLDVIIQFYDDGGNFETLSPEYVYIPGTTNIPPSGTVTISGTPTQGQTLTASNTLADADGLGAITYTWRAGSTTVGTGATYTLKQAEVGKTITVTASYTDGGNNTESVTSAATTTVANINDAPTGPVTITGTAAQRQTLTASNTLVDPDGLGAITYTWKAGATALGTGNSYTLTQAEVGKTVTVTASYTDGGNAAESVTSAATVAVANVDDESTGTLDVSGNAKEGSVLTASLSNVVDADGATITAYQWQQLVSGAWSDLSLGKGSTFFIPSDGSLAGKSVRVIGTTTDALGGTTQFVSETLVVQATRVPVNVEVRAWKTSDVLPNVEVSFGASKQATDAAGMARFTSMVEPSVAVSATMNPTSAGDSGASQAVTLKDAVVILKMIAGQSTTANGMPVSRFQSLAADFDGSGAVSLADVLGVLRHAVGFQAPTPSWVFVEEGDDALSSILSPGIPGPVTVEVTPPGPVAVNLIGVLRGDVDGSYGVYRGLTITSDEPAYSMANIAGGSIIYTFNFDNAVIGFTADDVTVTGGRKGAFSGVSTTIYTLEVLPNAGAEGTLTVSVAANAAQDVDGNASMAQQAAPQVYDLLAPAAAITDDRPGLTNAAITYTFTFSEAVTGFTVDDVTVANGAKGAFTPSTVTGVAGRVYTLVVTPTAGFEGNVTVNVAAGAASDTAGNASKAALQSVQAVDTKGPVFGGGPSIQTTAVENQPTLYTSVASDASGTVGYTLSGVDAVLLSINSTGVVSLKSGVLDFDATDAKKSYSFDVVATDAFNNATAQSAAVSVTNDTSDDRSNRTTVSLDALSPSGTAQIPVNFDASQGAFMFTDDATRPNFTEILGYGADDALEYLELMDAGWLAVSSDVIDVELRVDISGQLSLVILKGAAAAVISADPDAIIYDIDSFNALPVGDLVNIFQF